MIAVKTLQVTSLSLVSLLTIIVARGLRFYLVTSLTVHFNAGKKDVRTEN